ncbi:MAG: M48 family metalloprotease, partial [Candidatus Aminicenantes bacterium]|nr:M48 family metalloprotease [Candidatus Aminicenantes bacterium]
MYEQISRNKWKSIGLIVFFMAFIFLLTWFFEVLTGWGKGGLVLAVVVAMGMAAVGYYSSDKIVLAISRARPVSKEEFPYLYNVVEGVAIAAGIPAPRCYVIEDTAPNAFAAGRKPETAVICVTTGILDKLNRV